MNTSFKTASFKCGTMLLASVSLLQGCGCDEQAAGYAFPEFKETVEAEFEIISNELFGLNAISDIAVHDSAVIVTAFSLEDGKIHIPATFLLIRKISFLFAEVLLKGWMMRKRHPIRLGLIQFQNHRNQKKMI